MYNCLASKKCSNKILSKVQVRTSLKKKKKFRIRVNQMTIEVIQKIITKMRKFYFPKMLSVELPLTLLMFQEFFPLPKVISNPLILKKTSFLKEISKSLSNFCKLLRKQYPKYLEGDLLDLLRGQNNLR